MKSSSNKPSCGDEPRMQRVADFIEWSEGAAKLGASKLLLETIDRMVYASNENRSIIYANWSLEGDFGWVYAIPIRWDTRYRKFKEITP